MESARVYNITHFNDDASAFDDRLGLLIKDNNFDKLTRHLTTEVDHFGTPKTNYVIFYKNSKMYLLGFKNKMFRVTYWHVSSPDDGSMIKSMPIEVLNKGAIFKIGGVCTFPIEHIREWKKAIYKEINHAG